MRARPEVADDQGDDGDQVDLARQRLRDRQRAPQVVGRGQVPVAGGRLGDEAEVEEVGDRPAVLLGEEVAVVDRRDAPVGEGEGAADEQVDAEHPGHRPEGDLPLAPGLADDPADDRGRGEDDEQEPEHAPARVVELARADQDADRRDEGDRGDRRRGVDQPPPHPRDVEGRDQGDALEPDRDHLRGVGVGRGELERDRDQDQDQQPAVPEAVAVDVTTPGRSVPRQGGALHGPFIRRGPDGRSRLLASRRDGR